MKNRLLPGQKAKSIAILEEEKKMMTSRKIDWLKELTNKESDLPKSFTDLTIKGLCDYQSKKLKLNKIQVNTFKKHLKQLFPLEDKLPETKKSLLNLRNKKSGKKNPSKRSTENVIKRMSAQIKELKLIITNQTDDLFSLRYGYIKSLELLDSVQTKDASIIEAIKMHRSLISLRIVKRDYE